MSTSRPIDSLLVVECLMFLRYSLKARRVHLLLVILVLLSSSDRESNWLPGLINGFDGPESSASLRNFALDFAVDFDEMSDAL